MNIRIRNNKTGRETYYTPEQLKGDARRLVHSYGKLHAFDVVVNDGGSVQLVASYTTKDGDAGFLTQAL